MGDIKILLAYNQLIGVIKKPSIGDYWTHHPCLMTPFFNKYLSRNSFQLLMSNLHFVDDRKNPKRGEDGHDPLGKLRNVFNTFQKQFRASYIPLRDLGLDEMGCKFHGRCIYRQYNPSKPDKYHLKFYAVAESETGYLVAFEMYIGKGPPTTVEMMRMAFGGCTQTLTFGEAPWDRKKWGDPGKLCWDVFQMLHKFRLLDHGHCLYTDNHYTGVVLAKALMGRSTYLCGTICSGAKFWPKGLRYAKAGKKKYVPPKQTTPPTRYQLAQTAIGEKSRQLAWRRSLDGKILGFTWADRKKVSILSTIHQAKEKQIARRKDVVWRPIAVDDYNHKMNAVDTCDQTLRYYELQRRSFHWTRKVFFHLLNMATMNAYVLYKIAKKKQGGKPISHLQFRLQVVQDLIADGLQECNFGKQTDSPQLFFEGDQYTGRHFPEDILTAPGSKRKQSSLKCNLKNCNKYTSMHCPTCRMNLCKWPCFKVYHTQGLTVEEELRNHACKVAHKYQGGEIIDVGLFVDGDEEEEDLNNTLTEDNAN